ncbi:MAG: HAD-IC family P-type ATPase, partial [Bacteroidales bacterium]
MESFLEKLWHHLPIREATTLLETDLEKGLDTLEVKHRAEHFGPNALTATKGKTKLERFMLQFHQPLVYILIVAGIITAALGEVVDSFVIVGVVLVNAVVGYIQEAKAAGALEALARAMVTEAVVIRSGATKRVAAEELVPGDVVVLRSGDKVPADLRLAAIKDLRVDESALTGESVPVGKNESELPHGTVLADRRNMAYASTLVTYGQATGIVVATGDHTEIGRISTMVSEAEELATPLTRKIASFSHILLWAILGLAALTFVAGILRGEKAADMFMAAVALAVGAIPEGLPAAVTVILAMGVSRMAARGAIIRKLPAVETLGGASVICSDKTGTLTENQMTVTAIYAGRKEHAVSGTGYR